jgi:Tfp pilus assembly protein PilZ
MNTDVPMVVLTEIALPKMNGISLFRSMRESPSLKAIPVIILTSETDPGLRDTCLRAGCAAYLNKPFDPDVLYRTIQSVSESSPRRNIRLATSFPVIIGGQDVAGGERRTDYATALSEGGIFIRTLYPLPVNAVRPLMFTIRERSLNVTAAVLYTYSVGQGPYREPGMGMKFIEVSDTDKRFIRDFINQKLTGDIE